MTLKRKLFAAVCGLLIAALVYCWLPHAGSYLHDYDQKFFYPFQSLRAVFFSVFPVSLGDLLYILAGAWLLFTVVRWGRYLFAWASCKETLARSLLSTVITIAATYLLFIVCWGANYYKPSVSEYWGLKMDIPKPRNDSEAAAFRQQSLTNLIGYNELLVGKLNELAPRYHTLRLDTINARARRYYHVYTDCKVVGRGLDIKPSMFGYWMERVGVEGYYNPFTGEGQVDSGQPAFNMPFLACHEMAHQAGIAVEEDANLVAYALCTVAADSTFRYSAYLNIWLYASHRLYRRDSARARLLESRLNPLTRAHIDTLDLISKKYQNDYARYSTRLYDSYLKMQDQKEGIRSYGNVVTSSWLLEQKRRRGDTILIRLP